MRKSAFVLAMIALSVTAGGAARASAQGAFRTVRGRIVSDDGSATPLRRVVRGRVVLDGDASNAPFDLFGVGLTPGDQDYSAAGLDSPGAGVDEDGRFEVRGLGPRPAI